MDVRRPIGAASAVPYHDHEGFSFHVRKHRISGKVFAIMLWAAQVSDRTGMRGPLPAGQTLKLTALIFRRAVLAAEFPN
jgi:hypothetical protein